MIRVHSQEAARQVKEFGLDNDLIARLKQDANFAKVDLESALDARKYIGRAPEQVDAFLAEIIEPIRLKYKHDLDFGNDDLHV